MEATTVFEEFKLRTRLAYLAFKRGIWFMETMLLVLIVVGLHVWGSNPELLLVLFILQATRVWMAARNHTQLATQFNTPDALPFG